MHTCEDERSNGTDGKDKYREESGRQNSSKGDVKYG